MANIFTKGTTAIFVAIVVYAVFAWGITQIAEHCPAGCNIREIVYKNHE